MDDFFETPHVRAPSGRATTERVATIRRIFGLAEAAADITLIEPTQIPSRGITLISGLSGSGKSTLLRQIAALRPGARPLPQIERPETAVVDLLGCEVPDAIRWMSLFGLGESRVMTSRFDVLSEGQQARARLALLMWTRPPAIVIDEFLSALDRLTARVVAFNLQRICRREGIDAYLATAHDDLADAVFPDHHITVDLGGRTTVRRCEVVPMLHELEELEFVRGTVEDYRGLAPFHYVEHLASEAPLSNADWAQVVTQVRVARHAGRAVGAAVFSRPLPQVLESIPLFAEINRRAIVVLRVIVHPLFRGVGLTKALLQPELTPDTRCVIACSALGLYFPFFLGAGFERIEHPRKLRYPEHNVLDHLLSSLAPEELFALNKYDHAQAYYETLTPEARVKLRHVTETICTLSNIDYCEFTARLVGLAGNDDLRSSLSRLFTELSANVPDEVFGTMISEALYFPVQGFVRPIETAARP